MNEQRLQKFIANSGLMSRRKAEEAILEGRVEVNGQVITELGSKASFKDQITVDGSAIAKKVKRTTLALYKPPEVMTTKSDPQQRATVMHLLPKRFERLYPVGRLDYHSEGLILMTNDGDLAQRLMHPSQGILKRYRVRVKGMPSQQIMEKLKTKVVLEDGPGRFESIKILKPLPNDKSELEIEVSEGRQHFVRRMLYRVKHPVIRLKRVSIGPIQLGQLQRKQYRVLTSDEIEAIHAMS